MSVNYQSNVEDLKFQTKKYVDLDLNFGFNPFTKDVMQKKGDLAIKQSVKNLVLSRITERPFQPQIGSQVYNILFDNIIPETTITLRTSIENVINTFEPRAVVRTVECIADYDNNGYEVTIIFSLINDPNPITIDFFLEWLR
tara:strand:- start:1552 stop:1977 length:426 start_codon:yes stop_codon:yes gene_type:complete